MTNVTISLQKVMISSQFRVFVDRLADPARAIINTVVSIWPKNMHGYLSLDIICSSKLTVFLELRSRKTVRFSEQIMSADKYQCIFSRQMETIVYIFF